ncbi:hypothetical protein [Parerythrobacter lacustris]|uniref:Uncharacterized protein n=1 Tax=Parerythrobacter lacustris TaxID=2969984 RepID=A0ABT1XTW4_9SPHN|nr:hypothetical protein [Parerythrobacter lacustris]MCR2834652.1 hypothetical protein [Parerythrobacter lacustris]
MNPSFNAIKFDQKFVLASLYYHIPEVHLPMVIGTKDHDVTGCERT